MSESSNPKVSKLLRVLVAGGVALAGVAGTARAEDKPAGEKAEQVGEMAKDKAKEGKEAVEAEKARKAKAAEKAKQDAKAAAESAGGGVKGW